MPYCLKLSYRRRPRRTGRGWPRTLGGVVAAAALFAFGGLSVVRPSAPALGVRAPFEPRPSEVAANPRGVEAVSVPVHPNYKYSVIPGGVRSAHDLAHAIQTDEVVADHYRDVDPSTMHPQKVSVERLAHVSYRINDRVFWTKKPVRIYEGETILTNGETEIRARCGNAISMSPLLPTSDDEPDSTELDALNNTGPMLVAFELPPGVSSALTQSLGDVSDDQLVRAPIGAPFGVGAGAWASGASHGLPNSVSDGPEGVITALSSGCIPESGMNAARLNLLGLRAGTLAEDDTCAMDPPEFDSEVGFSEPGFDPAEFDPADPGPLVLQPLLGPEPDPTSFGATDVTPVPEPATLVLLGSGIAGLFARYRRQPK